MTVSTTHEFALYYPKLSQEINREHLIISQEAVMHRLTRVLRLNVHDTCILFDEYYHASIELIKIDRTSCTVKIVSKEKSIPLHPSIKCYVPILKRDALEEAIYELSEIGCTEIQLITTQKKHRATIDQKEFERLQKIMIAACEQAKHFYIPKIILPVLTIDNALQKNTATLFLCDPAGQSLKQLLPSLKENSPIAIISGPEGGFTDEEMNFIKQSGAIGLRLTPTILRAQKATVLAAGIFRSFLSGAHRAK